MSNVYDRAILELQAYCDEERDSEKRAVANRKIEELTLAKEGEALASFIDRSPQLRSAVASLEELMGDASQAPRAGDALFGIGALIETLKAELDGGDQGASH